MKTNINRPFLKREDIMDRRNFQEVLLKHKSIGNPFFKSGKFFAGLGIAASVIIVAYFYESGKSTPFINPPLAGINIPVVDYTVNPMQDTTLVYATGSSISIPANTFMDSKGHVVTGKVNVHYREFHDAVDFFVSGIPMSYDSGGVSYTFQSAGMMEIEAFQNGERLTMNPEKKINVSLASNQKEDKFNLYALDTVAKRWVYKGRPNSVPVQPSMMLFSDSSIMGPLSDSLDGPSLAELAAKEIKRLEASKPLEPKKAVENHYRFTLEVDANEFPEIAVYKNLMFEVGAENTNFDSKTDQTTWENVVLKENKKGKNYLISLSKGKSMVNYIVYPVFEGKNYDAAMLQYKVKYAEYEKKAAAQKLKQEQLLTTQRKEEARLLAEQKKLDEQLRGQVEKEKAESLAIQQKQENIRKQNQRSVDSLNRLEAIAQRTEDSINPDYQLWIQRSAIGRRIIDANGPLSTFGVTQQFSISGFGIWNCDHPFKTDSSVMLQAYFKDRSGNRLNVRQAYLIDKGRNMLMPFGFPRSNWIEFDPKSKNILFAVLKNEQVAVFNAEDLHKIKPDASYYEFHMDVSEQKFTSVKELKELLGV